MYFAVPILRPGVPGGAWSLSTFITFCHRQNKTKALDHMFFLLQNRHPLNNRMEDMSATPTGKNRAEPISCLSILVNFISLQLCLTQSTDENTWVEKMKYKWIHPKRIKERKSRSRTFGMDNEFRDSRVHNSVFAPQPSRHSAADGRAYPRCRCHWRMGPPILVPHASAPNPI